MARVQWAVYGSREFEEQIENYSEKWEVSEPKAMKELARRGLQALEVDDNE